VKSGALQVYVPCTQDTFPRVFPEGFECPIGSALLPALETLAAFVSSDTTKQAFNGILLRNGSAYATNNQVLVEYWCEHTLPIDVNIPLPAIHNLLAVGVEPSRLQVCERSATFHWPDGRWLRTLLYPTTWPATLTELLAHNQATPLPDGFFAALAQLAPFGEDVHMLDGAIATEAARVDVPGIVAGPRFSLRQLRSLEGVANAITFADYPQPCRFTGARTRGVILGKL